MDFLGIGVPELVVIILLALILIGPRDLPQVAGKLAKMLRDIRMMSQGFTTEWQREINAATRVEGLRELKEELESTRKTLVDAGQDIKSAMEIDLNDLEPEEQKQPAKQKTVEAASDDEEAVVTNEETSDSETTDLPKDLPTIQPPQPVAASQTATAPTVDGNSGVDNGVSNGAEAGAAAHVQNGNLVEEGATSEAAETTPTEKSNTEETSRSE